MDTDLFTLLFIGFHTLWKYILYFFIYESIRSILKLLASGGSINRKIFNILDNISESWLWGTTSSVGEFSLPRWNRPNESWALRHYEHFACRFHSMRFWRHDEVFNELHTSVGPGPGRRSGNAHLQTTSETFAHQTPPFCQSRLFVQFFN